MSFSVIAIGSPVGSATTATVSYDSGNGLLSIATNAASSAQAVPSSLQSLFSGAVDTSGMNKPLNGWLTYGGGGSNRPSSGFIYPRGDN